MFSPGGSRVEPLVSPSVQAETFSIVSQWEKFPIQLLAACDAEKTPDPSDRRKMVSILTDYMIHDIKDTRRKTADTIAKSIVAKFPKSFQDKIGGKIVGIGHETLRTQLYGSVVFRKGQMGRSLHSQRVDDENDDDEAPSAVELCPVSRKHDQYGCNDYQPILPVGESKRTQDQKRVMLCECYKNGEQDQDKVRNLMAATYPSQRLALNAANRDLAKLLPLWPYLCESKFVIDHANRLLDKHVQDTWKNNLQNKGSAAVRYFQVSYKGQVKPKTAIPTASEKIAIEGSRLLNEAKKAIVVERYEVPKTGVIFFLVANHFKEEAKSLYKFFSVSTLLLGNANRRIPGRNLSYP